MPKSPAPPPRIFGAAMQSRLADFDEQLWPIFCALVALAGCVAAVIAATSPFPDPNSLDWTNPRVLLSGWGRLAIVAVLLVIAQLAVLLLQRWVARRVLLCVAVGLLVHVAMGLCLHDRYLAILPVEQTRRAESMSEPAEPIPVSDYHWQGIDRPDQQQSFERPVETETPAQSGVEPVEKQQVEDRMPIAAFDLAERIPPDREPPDPVELARAELSSPRRAEIAAGEEISRKLNAEQPPSLEPIPQPAITPPTPDATRPLEPQAAVAQRRLDQFMPERELNQLPQTTRVPQQVAMIDRRPSELLPEPQSLPIRTPARPDRPAFGAPDVLDELPEPIPATPRAAPRELVASRAAIPGRSADAAPQVDPRRTASELPLAANSTTRLPSVVAHRAPSAENHFELEPELSQIAQFSRAQPALAIPMETPEEEMVVPSAERPPMGELEAGPSAALRYSQPSASPGETAPLVASLGNPLRLSPPSVGMPVIPSSGGGTGEKARPMVGPRHVSATAEPVPSPSPSEDHVGPLPRRASSRPLGSQEPIEEERLPLAAASGTSGAAVAAVETRVDQPSRWEGGASVAIAAPPGPGGLSRLPATEIGIPRRQARPESQLVHTVPRRFVLERSGGRVTLDAHIDEKPAEAFRQRSPARRTELAEQFGGSTKTELAVERGLEFLARHQFPEGHWSLDRVPGDREPAYAQDSPSQMNADTAATGLALLAFLGAGYTHASDKYAPVVRTGLDWLIANQSADGRLYRETSDQTMYARSYGHGIASIALCEAYGMTRDRRLIEPVRGAIEFIVQAQHPTRGGWRYLPGHESDTSISGWQLMALKSAQMAGFRVPVEVLEGVSRWLDSAQADGGARYMYNPHALDNESQRRGLAPNNAMTAEGLLMRLYIGWDNDNPALVRGADHLKQNLPDWGTPSEPLRDAYYWYYATQVMFQMHGDHWEAWNDRLRKLLLTSQTAQGALAGSWDPDQPVRDRWAHAGGRLYVTAMNLLMLEVYYRHLPLFRTLRAE